MSNSKLATMAMASILVLGGCAASTTPEIDARFGESMSLIRAQQTINPAASSNTNPVAGLDGKAAKGVMDNYRTSFGKPPEEAGFAGQQINIGGSGN